ncbi:MAG: DNA internalization-related competence protein ComEC/Rec2 [Gallionellaceae bacterium]|nr:DNA internalization-related competence protein ComEC/Rec2 [Gallionellaceae bacterium]
MAPFALFFAIGVALLQQQAVLPGFFWAVPSLLLAAFLWLPSHTSWQRIARSVVYAVCAALLGFFYAALVAQQRLSDVLPAEWQGQDIQVIGVVAELPKSHERGLRFVFDVEQVLTPNATVPPHILLATYQSARDTPLMPHAGERWQLTVRLKQPHGTVNPHGFDFDAWMLERKLRASGYVHPKGENRRLDAQVNSPAYLIEQMRERVRDSFQKILGDAPFAGVLIALAIGDQGSIPTAQWKIFTRTGVNHLMSISGLHITLLAGMAFAVCYWLWRRNVKLTHYLPARKAAALIGLLVALGYALLAGYGVPAQRTVYMLATITAALWLSRTVAPSQLLAAALMVVLLLDPWAVLSPGFWLSFGAVALIFYITAHRLRPPHWLVTYGQIQWAMSIGLIPPLLAMFQQVSLVSPVANAFAIPLVSLVVVPLTLLGVLLPFEWPLWLAHQIMSICMTLLQWLNHLPAAVWTQHAPPLWSIALGMGGVLWLLLPRGFPARWLGLLMMLPMFLVLPDPPMPGALRLVIFDVGQGLAVAAQTHNHALLYDTGPDFSGEADSGNRILLPSLQALGIAQLDGLMLSHDDSDHTGGALSVLQGIPVGWLASPLASDHVLLQQASSHFRCANGQSWEWDGVRFAVLHPSAASYKEADIRDNNRGCVLKITTEKYSVLLAADIEKESEARLLQRHADKLPATLLVVPHHGSKTSSTSAFVEAVHPRYAVFTVGYRNRFGHPKADVVERYRAIGSELLRSDEDGALIVEMDAQHFSIERSRESHARYWH